MSTQAQDTYFLDWQDALRAARQAIRVPLTIAATGSQICYYDGSPAPGSVPPTMINLPLTHVVEFFLENDHRMPEQIHFPASMKDKAEMEAIAKLLAGSLADARKLREKKAAEYLAMIRQRPPPSFDPDRPLRVLLPTSRYTTVMRYASLGLARAFEWMGCEASYLIEEDDLRVLDALRLNRAIHDFDPHVVVQVNHLKSDLLNPGTINVTWWQDPMPEIVRGEPLPWRDRDLAYIIARHPFEGWLRRTGLSRERLRVQTFCIDTEVFRPDPESARENKIVFVGSSARNVLTRTPEERRLIATLVPRVLAGEPLVQRDIETLAERFGVPKGHAYFRVHHYLIRDLPVRWLCRQSRIKVEVYGRFWDKDEVVAPFYRGEVPHGQAVAEIYRSARYALSCHSQLVQNQRMAEAAACGAIPVVFDCRYHSEPPHWDDCCLFFRTPGELLDCLRREVPTDPERFREHYSYERFARRILKDAEEVCGHDLAPALALAEATA